MSDPRIQEADIFFDNSGQQQSLTQIVDILKRRFFPLDIVIRNDGLQFESVAPATVREGICALRGELAEGDVIAIQLLLAPVKGDVRVSAPRFFKHLSELSDKCRVVDPAQRVEENREGLWIELKASATPLSFSRMQAFVAELEKLDQMARLLRAALPECQDHTKITKLYDSHKDSLEPIYPDPAGESSLPVQMRQFANRVFGFLNGGASVALEASCMLVSRYCMRAIASCGASRGKTLGQFKATTMSVRALGEMARKAPGLVALSAPALNLGSNAYEMASEVSCMLSALSADNTPVLFYGSQAQLQSVFGGGQGGGADPLSPVVCHAPEVELDDLVRFAVHDAARAVGGIAAADERTVVSLVVGGVQGMHRAAVLRIVQAVVNRSLGAFAAGATLTEQEVAGYAAEFAAPRESLAGLSARPRGRRAPEVQHRYVAVLTDPALLDYFKEHLYAQDAALALLCARLSTEALTRPSYQPLCYCAQGTPGTGKSESSILLARKLDVPHVNIDAASMPDFYTASAQLLGSGRGIVGSYNSGRLEQVSKCHNGAVVEVSDLDHASESVRSALADLFLQVLGTGEAQSASGSMFGCQNIIFAFTMNLPHGLDESVRKRVGFNDSIPREELSADVEKHIKRMLSSAFLSRVGTPILFDPFGDDAMAAILERAIREAVAAAAKRLEVRAEGITLEAGLGVRAVELMKAQVDSKGARALHEHGRMLAADAFLAMYRDAGALRAGRLRVFFDDKEKLLIRVIKGDDAV